MAHRLQATQFLKQSSVVRRHNRVAPEWPSYQGTSQFVGTSPSGRVTVFVDPKSEVIHFDEKPASRWIDPPQDMRLSITPDFEQDPV